MGPFERIAELIEPTLEAMGYELVRVRLLSGRRPTLQVMVEPKDHARAMTVEDCAEISHVLSAVLDVADPIAGSYDLEVSSPGIDRPLTRPAHFERFAGELAKIETVRPIDGRRRFRGWLRGVAGEAVVLELDGEEVAIPLAEIKDAKLLVSERLLGGAGRRPRRRSAKR